MILLAGPESKLKIDSMAKEMGESEPMMPEMSACRSGKNFPRE
jgi:hypothetical protein